MGKIMNKADMLNYIASIGRSELFEEIEHLKNHRTQFITPYPRYLKAIRTSLVAFGYDYRWVLTEFRSYLDHYYLNEPILHTRKEKGIPDKCEWVPDNTF